MDFVINAENDSLEESLLHSFFVWRPLATSCKTFLVYLSVQKMIDVDVPFYLKSFVQKFYPPPAKTATSNQYLLLCCSAVTITKKVQLWLIVNPPSAFQYLDALHNRGLRQMQVGLQVLHMWHCKETHGRTTRDSISHVHTARSINNFRAPFAFKKWNSAHMENVATQQYKFKMRRFDGQAWRVHSAAMRQLG